MRVLFTQTVKGVGKQGDVKEVADGYAMNHLLPHNKAVRATDDVIARIKKETDEKLARAKEDEAHARDVFKSLNKKTIEVTMPHNGKGVLYQAISTHEIATLIRQHMDGIVIPSDAIGGPKWKPLKETGEYEVPLSLHGVSSTLTLKIT